MCWGEYVVNRGPWVILGTLVLYAVVFGLARLMTYSLHGGPKPTRKEYAAYIRKNPTPILIQLFLAIGIGALILTISWSGHTSETLGQTRRELERELILDGCVPRGDRFWECPFRAPRVVDAEYEAGQMMQEFMSTCEEEGENVPD
jgi:hypothetical protein